MLRAGIIGLGVGEQHIAGYNAHPECRVVSACDFSESKLESLRQKYPDIQFSSSADEIVNDPTIDIVSIASYDNFHCEQIIGALENNKHVFVEKPMVLFEEEAMRVREILKRKPNLILSSNLILRRYPRFLALKKTIEEGELGEIFYVEGDYQYGRVHKITEGWRGEIPFYSVVLGGGIHVVDLVLWLTQQKVTEVSAFGNQICTKGTKFRFNDFVGALLKFENGLVAKVTANFGCVFPHFHGVSVFGSKGTFKNGFSAGHLFKSENGEIMQRAIKTPYPGVSKGDFLFNFVEAVLKRKTNLVNIDEVFYAMSVCFAIERALRECSVVKVREI